jgi:hypothetical protein
MPYEAISGRQAHSAGEHHHGQVVPLWTDDRQWFGEPGFESGWDSVYPGALRSPCVCHSTLPEGSIAGRWSDARRMALCRAYPSSDPANTSCSKDTNYMKALRETAEGLLIGRGAYGGITARPLM